MARVQELMTPEPLKVPHDAAGPDCARVMWRLSLRHLPVVGRKGDLVGVISDFDVLQHGEIVGEDGRWKDRATGNVQARALARTTWVEARPDDDLAAVLREMRDLQRDVTVVVNDERHPIGIITEHDAVRWARAVLLDRPAVLLDARRVHTVSADDAGFSAFDAMISHNVRHLVVVEGSAPVGVLSWRDLIVEELVSYRDVTVGALVRSGPIFMAPLATPLTELAEIMIRHKVGAVPLLGDDGALVGIASRTDVIDAALG